MRATSLLAALPIAVTAIPLMAATLVPLADPSNALAERWLRPVPGEVARPFHYTRAAPFARGAHRGADLAAQPGTPVRAACGGDVVHAGPVAGLGGVVSLRCGRRRVSCFPLAAIRVRAGAALRAGAPIGTVAAGHGGLHLGVRRESDPFAYEDPVALLGGFEPPRAPIAPYRPGGRRRPRPAVPRAAQPLEVPRAAPQLDAPRPAPGAAPQLGAPRPSPGGVAPGPVWLGLALLLSGAVGSGTLAFRRRHAAPTPLPTTVQATR